MKSRRFRLLVVLASLLALLLSNAALAGYACPGTDKARETARMVEAAMPCAEEMPRSMDDAQPSLCHAHCQLSQQAAETFHPPTLAASTELGVVPVLQSLELARPVLDRTAATLLERESGPPLTIRNCCFRI